MANKNAVILIKLDPDSLTAIQSWHGNLGISDKEGFIVDATEEMVISYPDPSDKLKAKRTELMELVELNAKQATGVVEITFNGTEVESISTKIMRLADPEDGE